VGADGQGGAGGERDGAADRGGRAVVGGDGQGVAVHVDGAGLQAGGRPVAAAGQRVAVGDGVPFAEARGGLVVDVDGDGGTRRAGVVRRGVGEAVGADEAGGGGVDEAAAAAQAEGA